MIPTSYISVRSFEGNGHERKKTRRTGKVGDPINQGHKTDRSVSLAFIAGMLR